MKVRRGTISCIRPDTGYLIGIVAYESGTRTLYNDYTVFVDQTIQIKPFAGTVLFGVEEALESYMTRDKKIDGRQMKSVSVRFERECNVDIQVYHDHLRVPLESLEYQQLFITNSDEFYQEEFC